MRRSLEVREKIRSYSRSRDQRGPGRTPNPLKCGASLEEARHDPGKEQRTPAAELPAILWITIIIFLYNKMA